VQAPRPGRHRGLALVQHALQDVLLVERVDERGGRDDVLRLDGAPEVAAAP
jgi:hypothetical protein